MSEKYFTRQEAEELLPRIAVYLKRACAGKHKRDRLRREAVQVAMRIMMLGGSLPPYQELASQKAKCEQLLAGGKQLVAAIEEMGCVVRDMDEGIVDFPSLMDDEEIYLCWKLGEGRILYWHRIDDGFAGRRPLDEVTPDGGPPPCQPRI